MSCKQHIMIVGCLWCFYLTRKAYALYRRLSRPHRHKINIRVYLQPGPSADTRESQQRSPNSNDQGRCLDPDRSISVYATTISPRTNTKLCSLHMTRSQLMSQVCICRPVVGTSNNENTFGTKTSVLEVKKDIENRRLAKLSSVFERNCNNRNAKLRNC